MDIDIHSYSNIGMMGGDTVENKIEKNWQTIDAQEKEIDQLLTNLKVKNKEFLDAQKKSREKLKKAEEAVLAMFEK
jgi:hypothetical protein